MNNKHTKVQISIYAAKLKNVAGLGKGTSDPYAVVTQLAGDISERPKVLGKTEVIKNSLSPVWTTTFDTLYAFGTETRINVGIYDEVRKSNKPKPMGSATFEIGECLGARGNIKAKKIKNGGTVFCRVTKASVNKYGNIQLSLRGIKLKNVDGLFSKSDPFFTINAQTDAASGRVWIPVYRSKPIMNDLNPEWDPCTIPMDKLCNGDKSKPILVELFDWEKSGKHNSMGSFETNVNGLIAAKVMQNPKNPKEVPLTSAFVVKNRKGKGFGKIVVTGASIYGGSMRVQQQQQQHGYGGSYGGAQPKQRSNGAPEKFLTVNGVTRMNPEYKKWKATQAPPAPVPAPVPAPTAPKPAPTTTYSHPSTSSLPTSSRPSAATLPSISQLSISSLPPPIAPPESALPPPMAPPLVSSSNLVQGATPKFVDYLAGGCEINLAVAIDYTGSNGDPRKPGTLHYIHRDGQMNDYEKAITAVGSVVARYDSDQKFPVWGFGAKYGGVVQHCFQVGHSTELYGIRGIVEGYRHTFNTGLIMSGPTVFAEVIMRAAAQATSAQEHARQHGKQTYTVLLILTDGAVTDIEQTKQAIRNANNSPLSIVIVGIGNADFSRMQFLDDFYKSEGIRDIVQFVEFSRHKDNRRRLTQETLDEIPDQLVSYFHGRGIMPAPPAMDSKRSVYEEDCNDEEDIDLSMTITPTGEMVLENEQQAYYNGHSYGNMSSFLPPPVAPGTSTSNVYAAPHQSSHQASSYGYGAPSGGQSNGYGVASGGQSYGYGAQSGSQSHGYGAPSGGQSYGYGSQPGRGNGIAAPYGARTTPTAPVATQSIFYVQAPSNSYPGMQLQVKNPTTGKMQIVAVPSGVAPGGTFGIRST